MPKAKILTRASVGQSPVHTPSGCFHPWQERAIAACCNETRWAIGSPTGSGKRVAVCAMAGLSCGKTLIFAPQTLMLNGYRDAIDLRLSDGRRIQWKPDLDLSDDVHTTDQLIAFLDSTDPRQHCVCSTPTVLFTFRRLLDGGRLNLLRNLDLAIADEAHHSECDPVGTTNGLGQVLSWLALNTRVRLGTCTATWFRTNQFEILPQLPKGQEWKFFRYRMHEYLRDMRYLKEILVGFLIASPEDALAQMLDEGIHRTIVHIPPPGSRHVDVTKAQLLHQLLTVCGPYLEQDGGFRLHHRRSGRRVDRFRSSDLVTIPGRNGPDGHKESHLAALKDKYPPEVILALNLGLEGYDDPTLVRGLLIGARDSLGTRLQALGRLLRDVLGKRWVQFMISVPPLNEKEDARQWLTDLVVAMADLDWRIRPTRLDYDARSEVPPSRASRPPEVDEDFPVADVTRQLFHDVLSSPAVALDPRGHIRSLVKGIPGGTNEVADDILARVRNIARSVSSTDLPALPGLKDDIVNSIERMSIVVTGQTLVDIRVSNGCDLGLSLETIRIAVQRYYAENATWPNRNTQGDVPGHKQLTWFQFHGAAIQANSTLDLIVDELREQLGLFNRRRYSSV